MPIRVPKEASEVLDTSLDNFRYRKLESTTNIPPVAERSKYISIKAIAIYLTVALVLALVIFLIFHNKSKSSSSTGAVRVLGSVPVSRELKRHLKYLNLLLKD